MGLVVYELCGQGIIMRVSFGAGYAVAYEPRSVQLLFRETNSYSLTASSSLDVVDGPLTKLPNSAHLNECFIHSVVVSIFLWQMKRIALLITGTGI